MQETKVSKPDDPVASKWLDIYKEVCASIRATDDISFKLLGLVPTFSGSAAGALVVLDKSGLLKGGSSWVVLALAAVGFGITFGLFRWELRNIQKCNWLIERAAELESYALGGRGEPPPRLQFRGWRDEKKPCMASPMKWPWGKTEAEVAVYLAALAAWLVPAVFAVISLVETTVTRRG
jgi:hypothetical protein